MDGVDGSPHGRRLARVAARTLRPITPLIDIDRPWGVRASRAIVAGSMAAFGPTRPGTRIERVDRELDDGRRVVAEWVRAEGVTRTDAALYYIHGSGYVLCSARTHRGLTSRLSARTGLPVLAIDYRLAPRHPFPAAADDVRAGWDLLRLDGLDPGRIVVAADSAGGHLAVDLALQLAREQQAQARAQVLFSPLYDLTLQLAADHERKHRRDPLTSAAEARRIVARYADGVPAEHPRLRLSVADSSGLPPTLIQVGEWEMLRRDAEALAHDIRRSGSHCDLEVWPDQIHVFQALPRLVPESRRALRRAAAFLCAAIDQQDDLEVITP